MNQRRRARRAGGVTGRALLLFRLARQDIRHHLTQAVLLVVAIAAATAVLSLAFALNGVITSPYQQTLAATKGPDVVAQSASDPYTSVTSPADLAALVALNHAKGVAAHSGPYPIVGGTGPVGPVMRSTDIVTSVQVEGREPGVATVDQPKVTDGTWIRPGGVVVERSFAQAANLRLGQAITLNGHPFQVAENLFLALVAAFVGLLVGWRAAPVLSKPEADLIGTPGAPPLTLVTVAVAIGVALAVALASTLVPAIRAARMSTVSALANAPRLPRRRDSLIRLSGKLPVPALFGLRLAARRPRRAIFSAASIAVAVMGLVAALAIHAAVDKKFSHFGSSGGLVSPDVPRAEQVLTAITISLVTLAALTAIFAAMATVLDARRASAVTLALGATPRQVRAGLVMAQVISTLPGAILGLPLGIGLFKVAAHGLNGLGLPPVLWLVTTVLGTVLVVAALTSVPARTCLRRPVAEMLQTEAA